MDKNYNNLLMRLGFHPEQITAKDAITLSPTSVAAPDDHLNELRLTQDDKNMNKCVHDDKYSKIYNAKLTSSNKDKSKSTYDLCNETIKEVEEEEKKQKQKQIQKFIDIYNKDRKNKFAANWMRWRENRKYMEPEKKFWEGEKDYGVEDFEKDERYRLRVLCHYYKTGKEHMKEEIETFIKNEYPNFDLVKCDPIRLKPKEVLPTKTEEYLNLVKYLELNDNSRMPNDPQVKAARQRVKELKKKEKDGTNTGGKRTKKSYKKSKKANTRKHKKSKKVTFKKNKKTRKH